MMSHIVLKNSSEKYLGQSDTRCSIFKNKYTIILGNLNITKTSNIGTLGNYEMIAQLCLSTVRKKISNGKGNSEQGVLL